MCPEMAFLDTLEAQFLGYYEPETVTLVICPRRDCGIYALARESDCEVVRVLNRTEAYAAQRLEMGDSWQFQTFLNLLEAEDQSGAILTEQKIEKLRLQSLRWPS